MIGSRSNQEGETKLTVYGPKGIEEFLCVALKVSQSFLKYELEIVTIDEGLIFEDSRFCVYAKKWSMVCHALDFL